MAESSKKLARKTGLQFKFVQSSHSKKYILFDISESSAHDLVFSLLLIKVSLKSTKHDF